MSDNPGAIVVIGVGARTPLGFSLPPSAAAVRAGISVIQDHPFMVDRFGEPMKVTLDNGVSADLSGPDRVVEIGASAALDALLPLKSSRASISLVLAVGEERPGQTAGYAASVYSGLRARLARNFSIEKGGVLAAGHAGGILAMLHACDALANGSARLCLVGGLDSYVEPETLEWLDALEQLHSRENIYGFCPGEAAGFCLMATLRTARELSCRPLLEVVSVGAAREENRIKTQTVVLGKGLGTAFRSTFEQAPSEIGVVDRVICDMNGERYRGNEYGFAVLLNRGKFKDAADFETPADCWGDVGAASGPLFVGLVTEAEARDYSKGPLSLIWASSENGSRAAALLRAPRRTA
ncbi:beta-ketoacyl synthase [Mesorhizobium sp. L-8-10]|uniref:beta-ketoacyl synthase N-terminal-like domain-containing protein n=1 Tax=Mesorhizobium sp. L-8-10 TaxID=2744523 RepID=UPI0019287D99|nr:beta-ketoacyl synthase N-terminal-like domain-containing protein [Mesorhizobium sp. L-8-10]BCH33437.1 beta-ketoacyl synthase [Mesorhizobium sp. L-8-10]